MKKLLFALTNLSLVLALAFSLSACGGADTKADTKTPEAEAEPADEGEQATEEEAPKKELKKFEGNKMERAEEDE